MHNIVSYVYILLMNANQRGEILPMMLPLQAIDDPHYHHTLYSFNRESTHTHTHTHLCCCVQADFPHKCEDTVAIKRGWQKLLEFLCVCFQSLIIISLIMSISWNPHLQAHFTPTHIQSVLLQQQCCQYGNTNHWLLQTPNTLQ